MMARIRTIKPDLWFDEELAELPHQTRLFFIALFNQADRRGRLEDRPGKLKAQILPYEKADAEAILQQLHPKFAVRYQVQSRKYLWIRTFEKHQRVDPREPESTIPAYTASEHCDNTVDTVSKRLGKEGKGKEGNGVVASPPSLTPQDFLQAWNEICASEGLPQVTNLSNGRKTKIKARIKTYPDIAFWERVFNAIPQSDFLMGRKANPKHPHWKATIDWLIENDENPTKVAEGAYG